MTDTEIIKALECCCEPKGKHACRECPLHHRDGSCTTLLVGYALDLINRQKAEIKRLQKKQDLFADIGKMHSEIKAEAVKEFAERLKKEIDIRTTLSKEQDKNVLFLIDNLVKETVGDADDK